MATVFAVLGVIFAALAVWLAVRIINRRERWAKRTAVTLIVLLALYGLSIGPAYWACTDSRGRVRDDWTGSAFLNIYAPIIVAYQKGPAFVNNPIEHYLVLWGMP